MKLLVDCHVFDGKFQGTRTYLEGIYKYAFLYKDIDFYFAAQNLKTLKDVFGEHPNIHYIQLKTAGSIKRLLTEFPSIIKKYKIDWVHFQYISPLIKCCKEIITTHDVLFLDYKNYFPLSYRIKNKYLFKRSAKRADILLTVSEFSRERIAKLFRLEDKEIFITPNGVERGLVEKTGILEKYDLNKYIMTVGRLEPRKNHLLLLEAFVELQLYKKGYKLLFIGSKDLKVNDLTEYLNKLDESIKSKVLLFSASNSELIELYNNTSLFVFPSFAEGFGIPPLEAAMYGSKVLCSNHTAMKDFTFFEQCFFSPDNIDELKEKMMLCLESDLDYNREAFADAINRRYNWRSISSNYFEYLRKKIFDTNGCS